MVEAYCAKAIFYAASYSLVFGLQAFSNNVSLNHESQLSGEVGLCRGASVASA